MRFSSRKAKAALAALSIAASVAAPAAVTFASSHREAPATSQDPSADGTDLYAFTSPTNADNVVLIADYVPFGKPPAGPNYVRFGDDVVYAINVDTDGDAKPDWSYVWKFETKVKNGKTFLFNVGPNVRADDTNVVQTYDLYKVKGGFKNLVELSKKNWIAKGTVASPVIGPKSQADYDKVAASAIVNMGKNGWAFAGPRDDPFFVDLEVFDLLNLGAGVDSLKGYNVQSLVLEVPKKELVKSDPVIGVWTTSYRMATTVLRDDGSRKTSGKLIQVSRLGMPLVNEVVVPLAAKDYFNASEPRDDAGKNYAAYAPLVTKPELAGLFKAVLGLDVPTTDRTDLVTVFLTGVPGLNKPAAKDARPAEMLRLNTATAITPAGSVSRLGVFGGDNQGFPNGRRLTDDVTDIAVQAVAGTLVNAKYANPKLGDGVDANDKAFLGSFPYLASPHGVGYGAAK